MSSVRFDASPGSNTSGSRLRVDVPVRSELKRNAASATPTAVLRPSSATAMPTKPTADAWTSPVEPKLPAENVDGAREACEHAAHRHRHDVAPVDLIPA